jgi:hypothetical protein
MADPLGLLHVLSEIAEGIFEIGSRPRNIFIIGQLLLVLEIIPRVYFKGYPWTP